MKTVRLYTDGACSGNPGPGGWGAILKYMDKTRELSGGEENTTNNRMELTAVIEGFKALKREGLEIEVFSDSSYVMNCFRDKWYVNWQKNGWKNSKKEPVENRELWEELIALAEKHKVSFYRVKGHVSVEKSTEAALGKLYEKFVEWNGAKFSYDDFLYVTEQNNRADELANVGIDEVRE